MSIIISNEISDLAVQVLTSAELKGENEEVSRLQSLSSALSGQALIDYMGSHLRVNYVRSAAGDDIVLTNSGPLDIPPAGQWSIYFNHAST